MCIKTHNADRKKKEYSQKKKESKKKKENTQKITTIGTLQNLQLFWL